MTSVTLEQLVCFARPPATRLIVGKIPWRQRFPNVEHRTDHAPAGFHHVGTLKQRGVAYHAIMEQPLITSIGLGAEIISIFEIHIYRTQSHYCAGDFGGKLQ